jgi:dipeptidyl aminopeptidase/acylaminoacyl peptidase
VTGKRALDARDLYRLRLVSDPQIAPDGSRIAFVVKQMDEESDENVTNIFVVDRNGCVDQLTFGDKDTSPRWSPDGKHLAFLSGRKDKPQIYLLPMAGGEAIALTDRKLGAGVPLWSPDSKALAFTGPVSTQPEEEQADVTKENAKAARTKVVERTAYKLDGAGYIGNQRRHLFLIDVANRTVEQRTEGDHHNDDPSWSPDGRWIAFSSNRQPRWDVSLEGDIYVMPRDGGEPKQLTSGGSYARPIFSPDGRRVAFVGQQDVRNWIGPAGLFSVTDSGDDFRDELAGWAGDVGNVVLSDIVRTDDERQLTWQPQGIYFVGSERGTVNVYCAAGDVRPITSGRHTITGFSVAHDDSLAFTRGDATHPAEVFLRTGDHDRQLTHENDALASEVQLMEPEHIRFGGANAEESEGWLLPPRGHETGKHPLIVYIHGGPMLAHGEALFFEYQLLASQGFGVFFPNIHGSGSYGEAYQVSIRGDWGNLDYQDVIAGTEVAASRSWVDPERLGIAGGSYGGYMTNWVVTHTELFRAAVTERCLSNIISFFGTSDFGWQWNHMYGLYPEDDVQKLWDMSPIKYVANVTAPLLVIHSERDDRTPLEQGEQMFNALRRLGKTTKLIVFPEESHGMTRIGKPSRRVERLGYIVEWFQEHL